MDINDLKSGCNLYNEYPYYDKSYIDFLNTINQSLDLNKKEHVTALFNWLKSWACRHLDSSYYQEFSKDINLWYVKFKKILPNKDRNILSLTDTDIRNICTFYEFLSNIKVSSKKSLGPTCTAKTLFALRPNFFIPWDIDIRKEFHYGSCAFHYISYLNFVKDIISEIEIQCKKNGFNLIDLPLKIDRPYSTITKLIDEYHWITITKGKIPERINTFLV